MKEKLKELQLASDELERITQEISDKRDEFNKEHEGLFEQQKQITETITGYKDTIKVDAEAGFKEDGKKKRLGGIGIREYTILEYEDEDALKFAKEKDMFLKLDKKAFDNVAKTGEIEFVNINKKVTVTFPKKIILEE